MRPGSSNLPKQQASCSSLTTAKSEYNKPQVEFTSKKRGVYVEKNPTMSPMPMPSDFDEEKKYPNSYKTTERKQILSCLLEILSKRSISTQYSNANVVKNLSAPKVCELIETATQHEAKREEKSIIVNTTIISQPPILTEPLAPNKKESFQYTNKNSGVYVIKDDDSESGDANSDISCSCCSKNSETNSWLNLISLLLLDHYSETEDDDVASSPEEVEERIVTAEDIDPSENRSEQKMSGTSIKTEVMTRSRYDSDSMVESIYEPLIVKPKRTILTPMESPRESQEIKIRDFLKLTPSEFEGLDVKESEQFQKKGFSFIEELGTDVQDALVPETKVETPALDANSEAVLDDINSEVVVRVTNSEALAKETNNESSTKLEDKSEHEEDKEDDQFDQNTDIEEGRSNSLIDMLSRPTSDYGHTIQKDEVQVECIHPLSYFTPYDDEYAYAARSKRMNEYFPHIRANSLLDIYSNTSFQVTSAKPSRSFKQSTSEFTNRKHLVSRTELTPRKSAYSSRNSKSSFIGRSRSRSSFSQRRYTASEYAARIVPTLYEESEENLNMLSKKRGKKRTKKRSKKFITRQKIQKKILLKSFKKELEKDMEVYREPENLFEALHQMAGNKQFQSRKSWKHYERGPYITQSYKTVTFVE